MNFWSYLVCGHTTDMGVRLNRTTETVWELQDIAMLHVLI